MVTIIMTMIMTMKWISDRCMVVVTIMMTMIMTMKWRTDIGAWWWW